MLLSHVWRFCIGWGVYISIVWINYYTWLYSERYYPVLYVDTLHEYELHFSILVFLISVWYCISCTLLNFGLAVIFDFCFLWPCIQNCSDESLLAACRVSYCYRKSNDLYLFIRIIFWPMNYRVQFTDQTLYVTVKVISFWSGNWCYIFYCNFFSISRYYIIIWLMLFYL